jgi:hypothetical protein
MSGRFLQIQERLFAEKDPAIGIVAQSVVTSDRLSASLA